MNVANARTATFERTKVSFDSGGLKCAGYRYRPAGIKGNVPCIVAEHFDFYHGEMFERVVADQIDFLRTHLVDLSR
jgi:hypothetical protein